MNVSSKIGILATLLLVNANLFAQEIPFRQRVHRMIWWCRLDGWVSRWPRCRRWTQRRLPSLITSLINMRTATTRRLQYRLDTIITPMMLMVIQRWWQMIVPTPRGRCICPWRFYRNNCNGRNDGCHKCGYVR